jgi:hypothetical protein
MGQDTRAKAGEKPAYPQRLQPAACGGLFFCHETHGKRDLSSTEPAPTNEELR